jgi:GR25 family glycosyltransferase involved in LPS biosynthesis
MNVSLICACKNRIEPLKVSLSSWLLKDEIKELIIVDWSSDESISYLSELDERIKIITVQNEKYFNQPQPLNLAASIATGDYILKVDTDYLFNPYYNFFESYIPDDVSFVSGNHEIEVFDFFDGEHYIIDPSKMSFEEMVKYVNSYSPYFKYLKGLIFSKKEFFDKIGGYNENLGKYYAYEDDEICHRLELLGLQHKKLHYDHTLIHIAHPDKKRTENFEGYNKNDEDYIRNNLTGVYSEDTVQWQTDYALAQHHIKRNTEIVPFGDEYYVERKIKWDIQQVDDQHYYAEKIMNKLENFPTVYYMSLEESVDRQKNIEEQFLKYDIVANPFKSKRFAESDDVLTGKYLHQLNAGTAGCCVSHLKAIKKWYEETEEDYAFFCEDDLSLETVQYWDFTWEQFVNKLPSDWDVVQLLTIRNDFDTFELRERYWNDWSATAYIIKRDYAKRLIDNYILEDTYHLEVPNSDVMPLIENILFTVLGKAYTIPLLIEEIEFDSTFSKQQDDDVNAGQKRDHYHASQTVLNWWKEKSPTKIIKKEKSMKKSFNIEKTNSFAVNDIEKLLTDYSLDTENPDCNFNMGMWYWNQEHTAPALAYFLRCAERADNDLLAYEALVYGHFCYEKQGTRDATARTLLQHALCLLPERPEAYFLLARFHEKRQQWQDAYIYASQGIIFSSRDVDPLRTSCEYPGEYGLYFEKAVSSYWWGKGKETRQLFQYIKNNYKLDQIHYDAVQSNLMQLGSGDIPDKIIKYQKEKHSYLRYKFPGSENIEKNHSQAYQDMFILSMLNGKRNGLYLEIGAQQPFYQNNTAILETEFGWNGISIEIVPGLCEQFARERKNMILCKDALDVDYDELLSEFSEERVWDYLQLDCEPSKTTFEILLSIPFEKWKFAIITYEHDHYVDMTGSYREKSRRFLKAQGYELAVNDVSPNDNSPFEDWWYHPDLIDQSVLDQMKCVNDRVNNVVKYMLPNFILPS